MPASFHLPPSLMNTPPAESPSDSDPSLYCAPLVPCLLKVNFSTCPMLEPPSSVLDTRFSPQLLTLSRVPHFHPLSVVPFFNSVPRVVPRPKIIARLPVSVVPV